MVEKPLTLDSESAKKLCDYAEKMNVKLMVGHVLLFHPAFKKMKQLIKDGKIGEIQYIYSNRLNLGTFRTNENVFGVLHLMIYLCLISFSIKNHYRLHPEVLIYFKKIYMIHLLLL